MTNLKSLNQVESVTEIIKKNLNKNNRSLICSRFPDAQFEKIIREWLLPEVS